MEYRFIHHLYHDLGAEEHMILEAAIALSEKTKDDNFLHEIGAFIATHTKARYVIIGLFSEDGKNVHSRAFLRDTEALENIVYPLQGTPCEAVATQRFCYYPVDVIEHFPEDKELQDLQIACYLGSILVSAESEPIGLIALMDEKPLENPAFSEHLILVLSPAIEERLIRLKSRAS